MKPEIKEKWVKALRSGEYQQCKGQLRKDDGYCCLGVLCDLARKDGLGRWGEYGFQVGDDENGHVLPLSVMDWAGMTDSNPDVVLEPGRGGESLGEANDGEVRDGHARSFLEIADLIEAQL